jgi:hypothetical protein
MHNISFPKPCKSFSTGTGVVESIETLHQLGIMIIETSLGASEEQQHAAILILIVMAIP